MTDMALVKQHVEGRAAAVAQAEAFLNLINKGVLDRDQEGRVLPGDVDAEEFMLSWQITDPNEFSIEPCCDDDDDDLGFNDDDDDGSVTKTCEVGFKVIDEHPGGAQMSVYVMVEDFARAATWQLVRKIAKRSGWQLMVGKEGWGENELEALRIPLLPDTDHCPVIEQCWQVTDRLFEIIQEIYNEE